MYCPNCKAEFEEGFKKCSDCGTDLVSGFVRKKEIPVISNKGLIVFLIGIFLLFFSFTKMTFVIIAYEYYLGFQKANGLFYDHFGFLMIPRIIWIIVITEIIISIILTIWGLTIKHGNKR